MKELVRTIVRQQHIVVTAMADDKKKYLIWWGELAGARIGEERDIGTEPHALKRHFEISERLTRCGI